MKCWFGNWYCQKEAWSHAFLPADLIGALKITSTVGSHTEQAGRKTKWILSSSVSCRCKWRLCHVWPHKNTSSHQKHPSSQSLCLQQVHFVWWNSYLKFQTNMKLKDSWSSSWCMRLKTAKLQHAIHLNGLNQEKLSCHLLTSLPPSPSLPLLSLHVNAGRIPRIHTDRQSQEFFGVVRKIHWKVLRKGWRRRHVENRKKHGRIPGNQQNPPFILGYFLDYSTHILMTFVRAF